MSLNIHKQSCSTFTSRNSSISNLRETKDLLLQFLNYWDGPTMPARPNSRQKLVSSEWTEEDTLGKRTISTLNSFSQSRAVSRHNLHFKNYQKFSKSLLAESHLPCELLALFYEGEMEDAVKNLPPPPVDHLRLRPGARETLQHVWLRRDTVVSELEINKSKLKRYVIKRRWIKAVNTIIALKRMGAKVDFSNFPSDVEQ
nr:unnamed protein product [Callosobruchus analis]